ncbi:mas-related G-protein coupled receptor member D-like [Ornithorhynchus anatinus]|uniref:G-protein coupled receptors family 1 profile domain-containing protein n=1 Tax=Ornithorhynchus anatinus TaxID=9258 RepID=A0A6I8N3W2_ORNAN|nr:mas-related G-protein coupled receptor member D-like [Ornithorhynchus anatinus]
MTGAPPGPRWEPASGPGSELAASSILDCPWCDYDLRTFRVIKNFLIVLTSLAGLAGNGLVLWFLGLRLKQNPFTVYILHLAGADFSFLLCQALFTAVQFGQLDHDFLLFIERFIDRVTFFSYASGLGVLAALTTERSLSNLAPRWYRRRRPPALSSAVCSLFWAGAFLWHVVREYTCGDFYRYFNNTPCYGFCVAWATLLFLLTAIMLLSSLALLVKMRCGAQPRRPARLCIITLLLVPVTLACGLPLGVKWFLFGWRDDYMPLFFYVGDILSCAGSSAHPLVYYLVGRQRKRRLRESIGVILRRAFGDEGELDGEEGDTPTPATVEMAGGAPTGSPKKDALPNSTAPVRPLPSAQ